MKCSIREQLKISCTKDEFNEALDMTMDYIKFNNIRFGKRTNIDQVISLVETSILIVRRCEND
ncbi:hypothetical protein SAMN02745163_03718 [Clostridium cavendishii DSM 21758]|uniref:Uncharacterized protein n=1 Tax=Clostridium cavendishii DSM 21758 TaxID=1121302 RepID=A0A1M6S0T0_9CLOT|nr:hypothetical protein [Clostridium cavendishii]SHK38168.1 hypothetical protein SAMN02745163_03718 [Clostridium cavendishii DSM 21758]